MYLSTPVSSPVSVHAYHSLPSISAIVSFFTTTIPFITMLIQTTSLLAIALFLAGNAQASPIENQVDNGPRHELIAEREVAVATSPDMYKKTD